MSTAISDEQLDNAMQAWARASIDATTAPAFTVPDTAAPARGGRNNRRGLLLPALAAATVLLLVAAGLVVRHMTDREAAPATRITSCPRDLRDVADTNRPPRPNRKPLFSSTVASMTACSYTDTPSQQLLAAVPLDHNLATQLARQLNNAATTDNDPLFCSTRSSISVLLARDDHGVALAPVTLIPGCRQITAFNDTTTHYLDVSDPVFQRADRYVRERAGPR